MANSASLPPPHQLPQLAQLPSGQPATCAVGTWAGGMANSASLPPPHQLAQLAQPTGDALIGGAVAASTRIPLLLKSHMQLAYHLGQSVRLRARRQNAPRSQCRDWVAQWHAFSEVALQTTSAFFIQMMYNICCLQSKIGATCLWQHEVTPGTRHLVRARLDGPRAHPSRPSDDRKQCRIAFKRRRVAKTSCGEAVGAPCTKSMLAKARGRAPPSPKARPACPQRPSCREFGLETGGAMRSAVRTPPCEQGTRGMSRG